jgi:preprotein translocase subunit SecE
MIAKIKNFVSEVVKEMKKVSWPTKEQLRESTMVVIVATILMTAFVSIIDWLMTIGVKIIFKGHV